VIAIVMYCRFAFGVNCKREGATLAKINVPMMVVCTAKLQWDPN
jgi:hypothetical protein